MYIFISLGFIPRSRIAGTYGESMFKLFLKTCQTFPMQLNPFPTLQQCRGSSFPPPLWTLSLSVFLPVAVLVGVSLVDHRLRNVDWNVDEGIFRDLRLDQTSRLHQEATWFYAALGFFLLLPRWWLPIQFHTKSRSSSAPKSKLWTSAWSSQKPSAGFTTGSPCPTFSET